MSDFDADRSEVLARARGAGVEINIAVGYDLESSRQAISLAEKEQDVFTCIAIHPHHASDATADCLAKLESLASHPRVVGIGEIGLDYYRNRSPRDTQEMAFRTQLQLAASLRLPVAIHDREAHSETMRILNEEAGDLPAVILHCFSGDQDMATEAWRRGYYTAVGGPLTYPNAARLRDLFRNAPRDRVLLETDAPYLPPTPHRGRRNEPAFLCLVADQLANMWGASPTHVAEVTTRNVRRAFGLPFSGGDA
jgi:TatD DNase family protein